MGRYQFKKMNAILQIISDIFGLEMWGLCSEPPTQTSDVYLNEVIGELERAYSAIESFIYDVNLFEKKAWQLKVIDDRGHQFFIQDLMDFDDIVRSSVFR